VGAGVIGDVELAVDVEDGDRQPGGFDPKSGSGGNLIGFAKFNSGRHYGGFSCSVDGSRIGADLDHGFRQAVNRRPMG
jgi:hypothetical protein